MDLESVAAELCVLPPAEFVARRTELAKAARAGAGAGGPAGAGAGSAAGGGDRAAGREQAEAIRRLVKPSAAAWAVNLLATRQPGEFETVAALGARVRAASERGEAGALAELSAERRSTLGRATAAALQLAEQVLSLPGAGPDGGPPAPQQKLSPAVGNDIEQTMQAVLADPAAAAAARTGRLVRPLAATGLEAVDLDGAVSGPFTPPERGADCAEGADPSDEAGARGVVVSRTGSPRRAADDPDVPRDTRASQARAAAEAEEAAAALEAVDRQLDELRELRDRARERSDALSDEIDGIAARLADLEEELSERRAERSELDDRRDETDRELGRLDQQREKAARRASSTARAAGR
ncbi:hypothetical protein B7R54_11665 [Subtercola boreus]|uniref:Uncharacterized protein n=1 Tax=Subtercola boreus TaxID=120213 RepID=A0A3E0VLP4_9MICO|nr:hypothetical protein [Subtercola boreus]RFA09787.1 hypothetical protein B7R54_11665 [Subtercola boreus]TQL53096.1 hypothetical protein FB464_0589 [Subtercola boreus]